MGHHEILLPLRERRRQIVTVTVDRPRRALLHVLQQLVHVLFLPRNRGVAAIALDDRFVRLSGGNEVHAVLGDLLVRPQHILEAQHVEREEARPHQILVPEPPTRLRLQHGIVEFALGFDGDAHRVPAPFRDAPRQQMALGIAPGAKRRNRLPQEEQQKHDANGDHDVTGAPERLAVEIERIEAAAQRPHLLAVEQLTLELRRPRHELALGYWGFGARGAHDQKTMAEDERAIGTRFLPARLDPVLGVHAVLPQPGVEHLLSGNVRVIARRERDITDRIEVGLGQRIRAAHKVRDVALITHHCQHTDHEHQRPREEAAEGRPTNALGNPVFHDRPRRKVGPHYSERRCRRVA